MAELLERLAGNYQCEIHLYAQSAQDLSLAENPENVTDGAGKIVWHRLPRFPGPHVVQFFFWFHLNRWRRWADGRRSGAFDVVLSPGINCRDADIVIVHALFARLRELAEQEAAKSGRKIGFLRMAHRHVYYAYLARLERRIYGNTHVRLAAVSQRTADLLKKYFQRHDVRVIPNGVDTNYFSKQKRLARRSASRSRRSFGASDFVMLLIGNDWRTKGLPGVLQAMAELPKMSLRLLVVGEDAQVSFQEMASRLGVAERCTWERATSDVLDCYAAADLYVSPSREDSFGLPVAEAMACGLPVVTSAFAGISEMVHDGADGFVLRDPHDVESLVKLIRMLGEQQALRERVGTAAENQAQQWTWDRHAAAVWEMITEKVNIARAERT